jgi:hypothetical protein
MQEITHPSNVGQSQGIKRRQFIAGTGAAALTFSILKPELVESAEANSKIDIGLIGCGGRGQWIADLFAKHGGYNLVAASDYFQDRIDAVGEKHSIPAARRFPGLFGYYDDIMCRVYGMEGTADTHYFGDVWVRSKDDIFNGGRMTNLYSDGAVNNIATFHKSVTNGDCANPTVAPSVRSNLTTILGRTAAYRRREVTWAEIMRANEKLSADFKGLKA